MPSSIDRNQPEHNHEDLYGTKAVAKIRELVKQAGSCFFCTAIRTGQPVQTRPMFVQEVDDAGRLWFLSAHDSSQNVQLAADPAVQLLFQGSSYSDFLTLYGTAEISTDRERIRQLWSPLYKTWFTEGIEDPRITVIAVTPEVGHYWDTKHNRIIAFTKRIAGAITGTTTDDSIQGALRV